MKAAALMLAVLLGVGAVQAASHMATGIEQHMQAFVIT